MKLADLISLNFKKKCQSECCQSWSSLCCRRPEKTKWILNIFVSHIGELPDFLKYCGKRNELSLSHKVISTDLDWFFWFVFV